MADDEDEVLPGETPIRTSIQVEEPDMEHLHQRLNTSLQEVRSKGRGAMFSQKALSSSTADNTTPAAKIEAPQPDAGVPSSRTMFQQMPVSAAKIANSPGTAAAFAGNDETLNYLKQVEQSYAGTRTEAQKVQETTAEVLKEQSEKDKGLWDGITAGYYQDRINSARAKQVLGATDPQLDIDVDENRRKRDAITSTTKLPQWAQTSLGMAAPLGEQALTGLTAAAGIAGVTALTAAPSGGGSLLPGVPSALGAFHMGMSARMGYDAMGGAYDRFLQLKTADGEPINPDVAKGGALAVGVINGVAAQFGFKYMGKALAPLFQKFGGGKIGQVAVEGMIEKAATNPAFQSTLLQIAKASTKTAAVQLAFTFINEVATGATETAMANVQPGLVVPTPNETLQQAWKSMTDLESSLIPSFIMGVTLSGGAVGLGLLKRQVVGRQFSTEGNQALTQFAQSEAKINPERMQDVLHAIDEHHGDPDVHSTVAVPPEPLLAMQQRDLSGREFPPEIERRIQKAQQTGQEVVVPTADYAAQVKTQPGAEKLLGYERFGDMFTPNEEAEVGKFTKAAREAREKDPIEVDTQRVAKDMEAKMVASGELPARAKVFAQIGSVAVRAAELARAESLGVEPEVFEKGYAPKPLEVSGGRENAALSFEKKLASIEQETKKAARREGAPLKPGEKAPSDQTKTPLQRTQEAAAKALGETFIAYRVEGKNRAGGELAEGPAFLRPEAAKAAAQQAGKEVVPVYVRPEEITGAAKGIIRTLPLDPERALPSDVMEPTKAPENTLGFIKSNKAFSEVTRTGYADNSTFMHEFSHYIQYTWDRLAPERMQEINKWLGRETGKPLTEAQSEKFVDGMEQFIMEGQAPNKSLNDTFQTLSRWLTGSVKAMEPTIHLDPELRQAYERMFAAQGEIDHISRIMGFDKTAVEFLPLSKEQMLRHRELLADARRELAEGAMKASSADKRLAREEVKDYHLQAAVEVNLSDINNLYSWLKTGNSLDGREFWDHKKLNWDEVKQAGFDPNDFKGLMEKKADVGAGYSPDEVAAMMGTGESGREVMQRLAGVEDFKLQASERANELFQEKHPEFNDMADYIQARGLASSHGRAAEKLRFFQLKVLSKMIGKDVSEKAFQYALDRTAHDYMQDATAKEIQPGIAYRAEAKAVGEMKRAIGKGDFEAAAEAARRAALNNRLFKELTDAKTDVAGDVKRAKRLADDEGLRNRIGRSGPEYLTVIDHILNGLGLRERPPGLDIEQAAGLRDAPDASLREALQVIHDRGEAFPLDNMFTEPGGLKPWQQMTYPDLKEVMLAVQTAEHLANQRSMVLFEGKQQHLADVDNKLTAAVVDSARKAGKDYTWEKIEDPREYDRRPSIGDMKRRFTGPLHRPEFSLRVLDRGKVGGIIDETVNRPIQEGLARYEKLGTQLRSALEGVLEKDLQRGELEERFPPLKSGHPMTKRRALMALSIFGDARNWEVMAKGEGMTYKEMRQYFQGLITEGKISAGDIEKLDKVSEIGQSLWPEIREIIRKERGQYPEATAAKPEVWTLPDGSNITQKGGYVPTDYDYYRAEKPAPVQDPSSLFNELQNRGGLPDSFTMERTKTGMNVPLDYDMRNMGYHLNDIARYVSMYDSLTSAKKILEGPNLRKSITDLYGRPFYDQFAPWLQDLATGSASDIPKQLGAWGKIASGTRALININIFGFKFATAIPQVTGVFPGMLDFGERNFFPALKDVMDPAWRKEVLERSSEVKDALHLQEAAMPQAAMDALFEKHAENWLPRAKQFNREFISKYGMFWLRFFTQQSSFVNFSGGVRKAQEVLAERAQKALEAGEEPVLPGSKEWKDYETYVGDQTVRFADSSSAFKDLPQFLRQNKWVWSFLNVAAGYASNVFEHLTAAGYNMKRGELTRALAEVVYAMWLPTMAAAIPTIRYQLSKKKDELTAGDVAKNLAVNSVFQPLSIMSRGVPMAGQVFSYNINKFLEASPLKGEVDFFASRPLDLPFVGDMERAAKLSGKYWGKYQRDTLTWDDTIKTGDALFRAGGYNPWLPYPAKGMTDGGRMLYKIFSGEARQDPTQFLWELATPGRPYEQDKKGKK